MKLEYFIFEKNIKYSSPTRIFAGDMNLIFFGLAPLDVAEYSAATHSLSTQ